MPYLNKCIRGFTPFRIIISENVLRKCWMPYLNTCIKGFTIFRFIIFGVFIVRLSTTVLAFLCSLNDRNSRHINQVFRLQFLLLFSMSCEYHFTAHHYSRSRLHFSTISLYGIYSAYVIDHITCISMCCELYEIAAHLSNKSLAFLCDVKIRIHSTVIKDEL